MTDDSARETVNGLLMHEFSAKLQSDGIGFPMVHGVRY